MKKLFSAVPSHWKLAVVIMTIGALIRLYIVASADFPLNDGGMFYTMTQDLINNKFRFPTYTTYNHSNIPYAYSPLAFYITGLLTTIFSIPLIELFRFLPWLLSVATLPFFYLIVREFFPQKRVAILALIVFILSPRSFQSLILGGGLTRSAGMVFSLPTLLCMIRFYRTKRILYLVIAGVTFGLCLSSHMEFALFTAISTVVFYVVVGRSKKNLIYTGMMAAIGLLVAAPWWLGVIAAHGLMPFISALQSNPHDAITPAQIGLITYATEPKFNIFIPFSLIGILILASRRDYRLLSWIIIIIVTITRQSHTFIFIPLAALAGYGIHEINNHIKLKHNISLIVIICALVLSFISTFGHEFTPFAHLSANERQAMAHIRSNTNQANTFIVISAYPGWAWFLDTTLEWFPALTDRVSLGTVQAYEWLPDFSGRLKLNAELKTCIDRDIACIEEFATNHGFEYSHVYISKHTRLEPDWTACCSLLIDSALRSSHYRLVFENDGAYVFERLSDENR